MTSASLKTQSKSGSSYRKTKPPLGHEPSCGATWISKQKMQRWAWLWAFAHRAGWRGVGSYATSSLGFSQQKRRAPISFSLLCAGDSSCSLPEISRCSRHKWAWLPSRYGPAKK